MTREELWRRLRGDVVEGVVAPDGLRLRGARSGEVADEAAVLVGELVGDVGATMVRVTGKGGLVSERERQEASEVLRLVNRIRGAQGCRGLGDSALAAQSRTTRIGACLQWRYAARRITRCSALSDSAMQLRWHVN